MAVSAPDQRPSATHRSPGGLDRAPYLATARAMSACAREVTRLADALLQGAVALHTTSPKHKPVARQSPGRCIVQLGPVAITVAWLRPGMGSAEDGELLVIVWRGAVAPRVEHCPERPPAERAASTATALWEQTLRPVASSEASWTWQPGAADAGHYSSIELAARCVERLRVAYEECDIAQDAGCGRPSTAEQSRERIVRPASGHQNVGVA